VIDSLPEILKEIAFYTSQITVYPFGDIERRTSLFISGNLSTTKTNA